MRLNSKGQVTIPAELRAKHGLREGDELDVIEVGDTLQIVRREGSLTRGERAARRLRGTATTTMTTDEIMELLRGELPPDPCRHRGSTASYASDTRGLVRAVGHRDR